MATIKVKLRPSTVEGKTGTIYYQLTHRCKMLQISTRIHLLPDAWNPETEQVCACIGNRSIIRHRIDSDVGLLKKIIAELDNSGIAYSVQDVVRRFESSASCVSVPAFMQEQIDLLKHANRLGTARNYEKTLQSFSAFLGRANLPLSAITEQLIDDYNAYLQQRGIVRNSISFYMRILRAVYNKAVRQKLVEQAHPFQYVYTGIDRTRKRAVEERVLSQLYKLDLPGASPLALARDLFIFSYCTRGMAFVDMAYLRKSDIRDGVIRYTRHKTRQRLCVREEPDMRRIIERYADRTARSIYVFPILTADEPAKTFSRYQVALNYYNRLLKQLSGSLHLEHGLSSYTARHSWATAARNHNVPISVISAGMGHTSERTTQIYLTTLENSAIDTANQKIIAQMNPAGS